MSLVDQISAALTAVGTTIKALTGRVTTLESSRGTMAGQDANNVAITGGSVSVGSSTISGPGASQVIEGSGTTDAVGVVLASVSDFSDSTMQISVFGSQYPYGGAAGRAKFFWTGTGDMQFSAGTNSAIRFGYGQGPTELAVLPSGNVQIGQALEVGAQPKPALGDNSGKLATTSFVAAALADRIRTVQITQAAYDALNTPDPHIQYSIVG